jgi:hypothetical protein
VNQPAALQRVPPPSRVPGRDSNPHSRCLVKYMNNPDLMDSTCWKNSTWSHCKAFNGLYTFYCIVFTFYCIMYVLFYVCVLLYCVVLLYSVALSVLSVLG